MKTAVIDGITGQDGTYLASYLLTKGYVVVGIKRRTSTPNNERLEFIKHQNLFITNGDITDANSINRVVKEYQPDEYFHLASQSHVGVSFQIPHSTSEINCLGTLNTLEAIRHVKPDTKYYFAASSEMAANRLITEGDKYKCIDENFPWSACSPYGASKIYGFNMTKHYREAYDIFACNGVLMNHESSIRGNHFVTRKITTGIADIVYGRKNHIALGNIDAKRDWGFAGSYIVAMHKMLQHSIPDDYVIAANECYSVRDFLKLAFEIAGLGDYQKYIKIDPQFYRPTDIDLLLGDYSKAKKILKWEPTVKFEELVEWMVQYDLNREHNPGKARQYVHDALWLKQNDPHKYEVIYGS